MESMVTNIKESFNHAFEGKTVLVTGHTGFKGSWLSIWLLELGAKVIGYSLDPPTNPNNFTLCQLNKHLLDVRGDVRDYEKVSQTIQEHKPEIIFHLAAQPIVLTSFQQPRETFESNVLGTVNILEAARKSSEVKTVICITSDKCYKDQGIIWGYRESEPLGGSDPYSASKGMAELAIASYQSSFFNQQGGAIASARAGNVIGGGDFAPFRLVPDSMRALMMKEKIIVRNPQSVRPWQHVLVPLSGYLWLAAMVQEKRHTYAEAWNFGPLEHRGVTSQQIVEKAIALWGEGSWHHQQDSQKETKMLRVSWEKAAHHLDWHPLWNWEEAMQATIDWFKAYQSQNQEGKVDLYNLCVSQIEKYTEKAKEKKVKWANSSV